MRISDWSSDVCSSDLPNIKANFLASPPLVVAYALAGTVLRDLMTEPVGQGKNGDVWLGDIWPSNAEVQALMSKAMAPAVFRRNYAQIKSDPDALWEKIEGEKGEDQNWTTSNLIDAPPFLQGFVYHQAAI